MICIKTLCHLYQWCTCWFNLHLEQGSEISSQVVTGDARQDACTCSVNWETKNCPLSGSLRTDVNTKFEFPWRGVIQVLTHLAGESETWRAKTQNIFGSQPHKAETRAVMQPVVMYIVSIYITNNTVAFTTIWLNDCTPLGRVIFIPLVELLLDLFIPNLNSVQGEFQGVWEQVLEVRSDNTWPTLQHHCVSLNIHDT